MHAQLLPSSAVSCVKWVLWPPGFSPGRPGCWTWLLHSFGSSAVTAGLRAFHGRARGGAESKIWSPASLAASSACKENSQGFMLLSNSSVKPLARRDTCSCRHLGIWPPEGGWTAGCSLLFRHICCCFHWSTTILPAFRLKCSLLNQGKELVKKKKKDVAN